MKAATFAPAQEVIHWRPMRDLLNVMTQHGDDIEIEVEPWQVLSVRPIAQEV